ncbi:hypothetical protein ACIPLC_30455 [Kitasatospora sp. NPDC086801]|uniref:hypothetical protein n=1 Tax=Kitasatospora sp. NPDC086801 TaxID=3364066 RepID=UPI003808DA32
MSDDPAPDGWGSANSNGQRRVSRHAWWGLMAVCMAGFCRRLADPRILRDLGDGVCRSRRRSVRCSRGAPYGSSPKRISRQSAAVAAPQVWSLGTIQFINLQKGYGYINDAGRALFFSTATVWGNWWSFCGGESVEFQVSGDTAVDVHRFPS